MRAFVIVVMAALIAAAAAPVAQAGDTYTFTGEVSAYWGVSGNWTSETGQSYPGVGDTAIIPNAKTCEIGLANRQCAVLNVQTGGTLKIHAEKELEISDNSTISGTLTTVGSCNEEDPFSNAATLVIADHLAIGGSGELVGHCVATSPGYVPLIIKDKQGVAPVSVLTLGYDATIRDYVQINLDLVNYGMVWVSQVGERLVLFPEGEKSGPGTWKATAGKMNILTDLSGDGEIYMQGADAEIIVGTATCYEGVVTLLSGTFDVDYDFTQRNSEFTLGGDSENELVIDLESACGDPVLILGDAVSGECQ